ncbi:MAG: hypothetical protein AAGH15_04630 [Myxococcota bacterium]
MSWQEVLTALTVAGASAYLVWKFGPGTRAPKKRRGPDVRTGDLLKKKRR